MFNVANARFKEDLADAIDVLFASEQDMNYLSFVRFLPFVRGLAKAEKHEWLEDSLTAESITLTASGGGADWDTNNDITDLPVPSGTIARLHVGDMLKLTTGEVVRISAIDTTANTVDLTKRGHGGTTAAAQGTSAFTAYIIGNAQEEGSDPIDAQYIEPGAAYNYVQEFEDALAVSSKVQRSVQSTMESARAHQIALKLKRLLSQLNYAMIEGVREKIGNIATMQGARNRSSLSYNVSGSLTVAKVYTMLENQINAGASPSAFHGSVSTISKIEQLFASYLQTTGSVRHPDLSVKSLSLLGQNIELHVDKHILSSEILAVDYSRVRYGTQEVAGSPTGDFSVYEVASNGKQLKEHIVGLFTMEQKQAAASVMRAYGIS